MINIKLKGNMSFVGPRPALFNQDDLVALRTERGVDSLMPGLTGWAQVNGRDELPQLWSILKGDMCFVGPRPALFNQDDLILLRTEKGVDKVVPGLTGWAQVNGRDELPIPEKVVLDVEYMERQSFWFDMYILWLTFLKVLRRDGITH